MSRGYTIFCALALMGAVGFYRTNALISLICFMMLVGVSFAAGRLG